MWCQREKEVPWSEAGKLPASDRSGGGLMPMGEGQKGDSLAAETA